MFADFVAIEPRPAAVPDPDPSPGAARTSSGVSGLVRLRESRESGKAAAHRHTGTPAHRHTGTPYASSPRAVAP